MFCRCTLSLAASPYCSPQTDIPEKQNDESKGLVGSDTFKACIAYSFELSYVQCFAQPWLLLKDRCEVNATEKTGGTLLLWLPSRHTDLKFKAILNEKNRLRLWYVDTKDVYNYYKNCRFSFTVIAPIQN